MARRKRRNWPLTAVLLLLTALFVGYVFVSPLVTSGIAASAPGVDRLPDQLTPLAEQIHYRLFESLIFVWLFMFGASIGSFLNVVIYRTPRGISLWGTSRCPRCCQAIRARDNLPVFGWLALRGRCRTCRLPISSRYPMVELTVAVLILVLATLEILQAGANLPLEPDGIIHGSSISWLIRRPNWVLAIAFAYHAALLCIMLSWALIRFDGLAVPRGYVLFATTLAIAVPVFQSAVQPVPWIARQPAWLPAYPWSGPIATSLFGSAAGVLIGLTLLYLAAVTRRRPRRVAGPFTGTVSALGIVGIALGWQAVVSVALLTTVMQCMATLAGGRAVRNAAPQPLLFVFLATTIQIFFWARLDSLWWWPGSSATAATFGVALLATASLASIAGMSRSEPV